VPITGRPKNARTSTTYISTTFTAWKIWITLDWRNYFNNNGGARICIGMAFAQMELKIIAAKLLRHYSWELSPKQNLTLDPIPTLHPRDGLKVHFQKLPR
jgi:cytochrome P450